MAASDMIQVKNLTKKFGRLTVLDNISTTFHAGEVVSVIGPSGGGKSTFLRCLNLLETPEQGQIFFEGVEITNIPFEKLMDTNDTTTANQIQMVMMSSLMSAITTLSKNVPEDTAAWLTSQLAAMMNPGSSTEGE